MHGEHFEAHPDPIGNSGHHEETLGTTDVMYEPSGQTVDAPAPGPETFGEPDHEALDWQYQGDKDGMCGPTSIAMVVNELGHEPGGEPLTGAQVEQWAVAHGDMTSDGHEASSTDLGYGMTPAQISEVLDHYGVPSQTETGGNLETLEGYLQSGHQVVLSVDAYQLWHDVPAGQDPDKPNHAVVLTGIDPHTGYAYINDPGTPDGREEAVPISELMSSWSTSDYSAVVTDATAPAEHAPVDAPTGGYVILPAVLHHELIELKDEVIAQAQELAEQVQSMTNQTSGS
jgi:uncharacterized protein YvpB